MADDGFGAFVAAATPDLSRAGYLLTGDHHHHLAQACCSGRRPTRSGAGRGSATAIREPMCAAMFREQISFWRLRRVRESLRADPPESRIGDLARRTVLRLSLDRALDGLSPRQRAVIVLRFYEDLTESRAAEVSGRIVGSVDDTSTKH